METEQKRKIAMEIKTIFERELGRFDLIDYIAVDSIIMKELFDSSSRFRAVYDKLSPELRDQIDFMMRL
jgi:hypothetical protein